MDNKYNNEPVVIALGFFDGVHMGHQTLIKEATRKAQKDNIHSAVLSFSNHPLTEIFPRFAPQLLMENDEKIKKLKENNIDFVFLEPFTQELMVLEPEEFITEFLLKKFNIKEIIVGFNYNFGYKGQGNSILLKQLGQKHGFDVTIVPPLILEKDVISSTLIRNLLNEGKVEEVNYYLGEPYKVSGTIKSGKKLGRKFNIPTANLDLETKKALPKSGVYFTHVYIDGKKYDGLTNLGYNPTFQDHPYSIETYIYDFDQNIYGKRMDLEFVHKIRDEIKFENLDKLFSQISSDIQKANLLYRNK